MGKLTQEVLQKLKLTAEASQQRYAEQMQMADLEHEHWLQTAEGLLAGMRDPVLLVAPSRRSPDERRDVILLEIARKRRDNSGQ